MRDGTHWETLIRPVLSLRWGLLSTLRSPVCVYTGGPSSTPSAAVTVPKPGHPLDPWSLCAPVQSWKISLPLAHTHTYTHTHSHTHTSLLPSLPSPSLPTLKSTHLLLLLHPSWASTPFLAHQPPSSPRSYPTALPSRSIPQAVHTEAYCVSRQTAEGSIQCRLQQRGRMCGAVHCAAAVRRCRSDFAAVADKSGTIAPPLSWWCRCWLWFLLCVSISADSAEQHHQLIPAVSSWINRLFKEVLV